MKKRLIIPVIIGIFIFSYLFFGDLSSSRKISAKVVYGPLTVWSSYEGRLESNTVEVILSKIRGEATVIELAAEGTQVTKGDLLARFDASSQEREVLKLERDYALAKTELKSLVHAELPLELRDLELKLTETRTTLNAERQYLEASIQLAEEGLISEPEIEQQKLKVEELTAQHLSQEQQMSLTKKYLHPSQHERARARLASAEQELNLAREQIQNSVIRAPVDGVVVLKPFYIGGEFRTIRVGDIIFPGQPFMVLPDMSDLAVHIKVPEGELSRVEKGKDVFVHPIAYPGVRLEGNVESVGSMAQVSPGRPAWQKFFYVVVGLKGADSRLRPGMSVTTHILSYNNPEALLIPRGAIWWEDDTPCVKVVTGSSQETRRLELGKANTEHYEVIKGLSTADEVIIQ